MHTTALSSSISDHANTGRMSHEMSCVGAKAWETYFTRMRLVMHELAVDDVSGRGERRESWRGEDDVQRTNAKYQRQLYPLPPTQLQLPQLGQRQKQDDEVLRDAGDGAREPDEVEVEALARGAGVPDRVDGQAPDHDQEQEDCVLHGHQRDADEHGDPEPSSRENAQVHGERGYFDEELG